MTLKNWLTLAASAAVSGAWAFISTHLGDGLPSTGAQWAALLVGALVGALGALVHLYQTSPPDLSKIKALQNATKGLMVFAFVGLLGSAVACARAIPVVGPGLSCVQAVVADAAAGKSLAQILADPNLGACVTTIDDVITILLGSTDPNVQGSPAYGEASAIRLKSRAPAK